MSAPTDRSATAARSGPLVVSSPHPGATKRNKATAPNRVLMVSTSAIGPSSYTRATGWEKNNSYRATLELRTGIVAGAEPLANVGLPAMGKRKVRYAVVGLGHFAQKAILPA